MKPHQQRVLDEHKELLMKYIALTDFLFNPKGLGLLGDYELDLLQRQRRIMKQYLDVLAEHIGTFS